MNRRQFILGTTAAAITTGFATKGYAMLGFGSKRHDNGDFPYQLTEAEWKQKLSPDAFYVLREHGTERARTSPLDKNYATGTYHCSGCDQKLFHSDHKFDSGTGWPSFYRPLDGVESTLIGSREDNTLFMKRTEVHCSNCGGHQGHVFNDGPAPTGLRYCINGVALNFKPAG